MYSFKAALYESNKLTNGPDDSLLQLPLLVSFDDLGADVGSVIRAGQLVVHAEAQLPQQGVEHLQHCRACIHTTKGSTFFKSSALSRFENCQAEFLFSRRDAPTEPLAAMAAASSSTSTMPARTLAEFLLLASRWPRSCWITKWECWDYNKKSRRGTAWIMSEKWRKPMNKGCFWGFLSRQNVNTLQKHKANQTEHWRLYPLWPLGCVIKLVINKNMRLSESK